MTVLRYEDTADGERQLFSRLIRELCMGRDHLIGLEIGVLNGETSRFLLGINQRVRLIGIDPIVPDSMAPNLIGNREKIMKNTAPYADRFSLAQKPCEEACAEIYDKAHDFIFFDGDHRYEAVCRDWWLYEPKLARNGIAFFHDSRMYRGGAPFHPGPSRFVDELLQRPDMRLIGEAFSLTAIEVP